MRAFVAIEIPEPILHDLASWQARFRPVVKDARWTQPESIHLTLKFLGEISESKTQEVIQALNSVAAFEPFLIEIGGFGFFPSPRRPRIFWAGVNAPPALEQLSTQVDSALNPLGFPPEARAFTPHLTLARFNVAKPRPEVEALIDRTSSASFGSFQVTDFYLWESRLSPAGNTYRKVANFKGPYQPRQGSLK